MKNIIDLQKLKNIRTIKGIGQKNMADVISRDTSVYNKIENGKRTPSAEELKSIADKLEIDINELFLFEKGVVKKKNSKVPFYEFKLKNTELYEKMLYLFSTELSYHFDILASYMINKLDSHPLTFDEYIDINEVLGPDFVLNSIRKDIVEYLKCGEFPHYLDSAEQIEFLNSQSDEEILEYVRKRENFPFAYAVLHWPNRIKESDVKTAFNSLFEKQPIFLLIHRFGMIQNPEFVYRIEDYEKNFLQKSFLDEDYQLAMNTLLPAKSIHKKMRSKMKSIIKKNDKIKWERRMAIIDKGPEADLPF